MQIKERMEGDVVILEPGGNLMGTNEVNELQDRVHELTRGGYNKVVLDLSEVTMISSTGMGMLLHSANILRGAEGDLHLARLTSRVHNLLVVVTQIGTNLRIFETADQAVSGFDASNILC